VKKKISLARARVVQDALIRSGIASDRIMIKAGGALPADGMSGSDDLNRCVLFSLFAVQPEQTR
jgi:outer membrane protein OmpA-like peptidoglycan-associated protein